MPIEPNRGVVSAVAVREKRIKHKPIVSPEQLDGEEGGSDSDGDQFAAAQVRPSALQLGTHR